MEFTKMFISLVLPSLIYTTDWFTAK